MNTFDSIVNTAARQRQDAEAYRLLQAEALAELFRRAHGRHPETPAELGAWVDTQEDIARPIDPYAILGGQQ